LPHGVLYGLIGVKNDEYFAITSVSPRYCGFISVVAAAVAAATTVVVNSYLCQGGYVFIGV